MLRRAARVTAGGGVLATYVGFALVYAGVLPTWLFSATDGLAFFAVSVCWPLTYVLLTVGVAGRTALAETTGVAAFVDAWLAGVAAEEHAVPSLSLLLVPAALWWSLLLLGRRPRLAAVSFGAVALSAVLVVVTERYRRWADA